MATPQKYGREYRGGARPGMKGALHDLIESMSREYGPKSVTQRKQKLKQLEEQMDGEYMSADRLKAHLRKRTGAKQA